jgi:hypothetical protein
MQIVVYTSRQRHGCATEVCVRPLHRQGSGKSFCIPVQAPPIPSLISSPAQLTHQHGHRNAQKQVQKCFVTEPRAILTQDVSSKQATRHMQSSRCFELTYSFYKKESDVHALISRTHSTSKSCIIKQEVAPRNAIRELDAKTFLVQKSLRKSGTVGRILMVGALPMFYQARRSNQMWRG